MTKKETQLITEAKEGKQSAFKSLLNLYWNDIYTFQLSRIRDENLAEDITIQTFSKAFDKIALYDHGYSFKTWLITISKNLQIDELRRKKTETISLDNEQNNSHLLSDDTPSPEDQLIIDQNLAQLLRFIKQLKPHYQKVINLRFFQELSYKEIAVELGEPMNNVKVKILRAKKLLSEIITNSNNLE
ncbi:RNA polymerase sigma factor [Bacteroidota bacterium]